MTDLVPATVAPGENGGAIAIHSNGGAREMYAALQRGPEAMQSILKLAEFFQQSQIMGVNTPGDAGVLALTCMADGITPIEFVRTNHIIQGKPCRKAEFMLAEFQRMGGKVQWIQTDEKVAKATFSFQGTETTDQFTIADAARMVGDSKLKNRESNWFKDPAAMLRWRLVTRVLRYVCPAATGGFYLADEIESAIGPDPVVAAAAKADRKAELEKLASEAPVAISNTASASVVVPEADTVDVTPEPKEADTVPFEVEQTAASIPDAPAIPDESENVALVSNETLIEIVGIAAKLGQTLKDCNDGLCSAASVANPAQMTAVQGAKMLERYKAALAEKTGS